MPESPRWGRPHPAKTPGGISLCGARKGGGGASANLPKRREWTRSPQGDRLVSSRRASVSLNLYGKERRRPPPPDPLAAVLSRALGRRGASESSAGLNRQRAPIGVDDRRRG
ncbi:hypothetical protein NL676_031625 [Syzygium grande]|nr:hypothetical protein NL676_031625 [Syzygium grande]